MQEGDVVQQLKSALHQNSNDDCFGKTADVRQVAIQLLLSRLMRSTDARLITYSFIVQLTYVMCNSEWYGHCLMNVIFYEKIF